MTVPHITSTCLGGKAHLPLLVVGPALGTSVTALWAPVAQLLGGTYRVIGWDLPGHGASPAPHARFTIAGLAETVFAMVETASNGSDFVYAGVSVGGAVGLQLSLERSRRLSAMALICTGAVIGSADDWYVRAERVRAEGTAVMVPAARRRWFAPGFAERYPRRAAALIDSLCHADDEGYAMTCEALARFDVRTRLGSIETPVLAIAGSVDVATPPRSLLDISTRVRNGQFVELPSTAHLAPAESPRRVAQLVASLAELVPR